MPDAVCTSASPGQLRLGFVTASSNSPSAGPVCLRHFHTAHYNCLELWSLGRHNRRKDASRLQLDSVWSHRWRFTRG
jgi:hypothetical protein